MDFDINLILVPVILVLFVAWLVDKFWLKQHALIEKNNRLVALAESHLADVKKEFQEVLERLGHQESVDEFVVQEHTPQVLINASAAYQESKHSLHHAKSVAGTSPAKEFFLIAWAYEYLFILSVIVVVRSFIVEPFNIPSSSMVPSLYTGDFIAVNKFSYGLRLPLLNKTVLNTGTPKHGDVVVFLYPENKKQYYIKRMIGLPGDTVSFDNGVLSINGQQVPTQESEYQMPSVLNDTLLPEVINGQKLSDKERATYGRQEEKYAHYYQENFGTHHYNVRYLGDLNSAYDAPFLREQSPEVISSGGTKWTITVPQGQYFVMGDNRDRSADARFWGFVPEENLVGRASYIWMHKDAGFKLPTFSRNGKID